MFYTKVETICDDLTGRFIDEYRQPFHNGEGDVIDSHVRDNAVTFHAGIIFAVRRPSVYISARSKTIAEQRQATQYAVVAKDNPVYVNLAQGVDASAYNLAVADWFGKPEVLEINTDGWTGGIGHNIRIKATDDTKVTRVRVVIHQDGNILEQGDAAHSETDGLMWTYVTTTNLMGTSGLQLDANAYDLPGNVGASSVSLS